MEAVALSILEAITILLKHLPSLGSEIGDIQAATDAEIARIKATQSADEAGDVAAMGLKGPSF